MKALFRKGIFLLTLSLGFVSQAGFAQARLKLVWMGLETAIRAGERQFDGLSKVLVKELKFSEIKGLNDKELGAMYESIRLAASHAAGGKEIKTFDEFVAAVSSDPELKGAIDRVLAKVDDATKTFTKTDLSQMSSANLGNLVTETTKARAPKIEIGASDIIPCPDCGITQAMRLHGVTIYLRRATAMEKRAMVNASKEKGEILKATKSALAQVAAADGSRLNLRLSEAGEKSIAGLSATDKALVNQVTKDAAGALDEETQKLARSFILFSRDGEKTADLAPDGDRLFSLYVQMSEGKNRNSLRMLLDDATEAFPSPGQLRERRVKFCQEFRQASRMTAAGQASMKTIDSGNCFGNIFKLCK